MTIRFEKRAHYSAIDFDQGTDQDGDMEISFDYDTSSFYIDYERLAAIAKAFGFALVPLPTEPPAR